ncbi:odorant receptor 131-2-like [Chanos chanos]|uniref:Odorant receptor 131-2-like n=1 Tax=Chanos chanos TaxID=29144 RepID=A0A6J2VLQ0_CHACN|nr:odorant receptor 131-2-like [Chanos chanos]
MTVNNTSMNAGLNSSPSLRAINERVIIVEVLIAVFLYTDTLLIFTFFQKDYFRTNTRYIFFVHTLLCDWLFLFVTNILLLLSYFVLPMPAWICVIICVLMGVLTFATPLTLTAMCLERYVAICMPLRHADIYTIRRSFHCLLVVHSLSCIQSIVIISIFFASVSLSFYTQNKICQVEMLIVHKWQSLLRSVISQLYFLIMSCTILFTYVKIMAAAKEASSDKKSTSKGRKTVILHAAQLLLCLIQLWCPFIEGTVMDIDFRMFIDLRYFDYIVFILAPRCLCPLVYGLRDDKFYMALKYHALCGLNKKISPKFVDI